MGMRQTLKCRKKIVKEPIQNKLSVGTLDKSVRDRKNPARLPHQVMDILDLVSSKR